jgi:hypothetical protein
MVITITVPAQTVYMAGGTHHLSRAGCNRVLSWLFSNAQLVRGWDYGEYVFKLTEGHNAAN